MTHQAEPIDVTEPLLELLRNIDFAFDQTLGYPLSPQIERERYATALGAIGRFLMKLNQSHADRFFELGDALYDLNIGARPAIFGGPKLKSVPNPTQIEVAKANVAFALDALIEVGSSPNDAAQTLLAKFPSIKNLAGQKSHRSGYSWEKTIQEWRKSLSSSSRRKNELAVETFSAGRELIRLLIKENRQDELLKRAFGRAKAASDVGVFVVGSNTR
jgi:hypothetical protein